MRVWKHRTSTNHTRPFGKYDFHFIFHFSKNIAERKLTSAFLTFFLFTEMPKCLPLIPINTEGRRLSGWVKITRHGVTRSNGACCSFHWTLLHQLINLIAHFSAVASANWWQGTKDSVKICFYIPLTNFSFDCYYNVDHKGLCNNYQEGGWEKWVSQGEILHNTSLLN